MTKLSVYNVYTVDSSGVGLEESHPLGGFSQGPREGRGMCFAWPILAVRGIKACTLL